MEIFLLQSQTSAGTGKYTLIKYLMKFYLQSVWEIRILASTLDLGFYNLEQIPSLQLLRWESRCQTSAINLLYTLVKSLQTQRAFPPITVFSLGERGENFLISYFVRLKQTMKANTKLERLSMTSNKYQGVFCGFVSFLYYQCAKNGLFQDQLALKLPSFIML